MVFGPWFDVVSLPCFCRDFLRFSQKSAMFCRDFILSLHMKSDSEHEFLVVGHEWFWTEGCGRRCVQIEDVEDEQRNAERVMLAMKENLVKSGGCSSQSSAFQSESTAAFTSSSFASSSVSSFCFTCFFFSYFNYRFCFGWIDLLLQLACLSTC